MAKPPKTREANVVFNIGDAISDALAGEEPDLDLYTGTAKHTLPDDSLIDDQVDGLSGYEAMLEISSETRVTLMADDLHSVDAGASRQAARMQPLPAGVHAQLQFVDQRYKITKSLTMIGRVKEVADVAFPDDDRVSRHHAAVVYANGRFWIEDLDSTNGTFLEGVRIKRAALEPGAEVRIGRCVFQLVLG